MATKTAKKTEKIDHKHVKHTARKKRECQVKGCKGEYRAKGYCDAHYRMWKNGEFGKARYQKCSKEGCTKAMSQEGLCQTHWAELRGKAAEAAAPAAG